MSEVEKHYATDKSGTAGRRAGQPGERGGSETGAFKQASDAVSGTVSQAKGAAREAYGQARERTRDAADWAGERYEDASRNLVYARRRSAAHLGRSRRSVEDFVEENPIMVGVAGLAVGLLVGALLPSTRGENRTFGRYADEVKDQGMRYAQDVVHQGRQLVEENLGRVTQPAGQQG